MDVEADRKFLHDIASPLAVCSILIKTSLEDLEKAPPGTNVEFLAGLKKRLAKIDASLQKMEDMHASHKALISTLLKSG